MPFELSLPLLVSSPNREGDLLLLENGAVRHFGIGPTTGLHVDESRVAVGLQGQRLYMRDNRGTADLDLGRHADLHDVFIRSGSLFAALTGRNAVVEIDLASWTIARSWAFPGNRDAWHINCLGEWKGRLCFSAFGRFRTHRGYKTAPPGSGFVADLLTGDVLVDNLSNPHSIVSEGAALWVCDSLKHTVVRITASGRLCSPDLGSYTRGLCVCGDSLFAGVSAMRHASTAGTASIVELDKHTLEVRRTLRLPVKEIYDIRPLASDSERRAVEAVAMAIPRSKSGLRRFLPQGSVLPLKLAAGRTIRRR